MKTQEIKFSIKKNDQVQVIAGREKGKTGKVISVDPVTGRITIEKVNLVKRHTKPTQKNPQGGITEKELPLDYSNVQLFCTKCNRGVRHGRKSAEGKAKKGTKTAATAKSVTVRFCKRCDTTIGAA